MARRVPSFARLCVVLAVVAAPGGCSSFSSGAEGEVPDSGRSADDASTPSDAPVDASLGDASVVADVEADVDCSVKCASGKCTNGVCDPAVFLSSAGFSGNLGGLSGADQRCQDRAVAAKLPGTFKAWVSTATEGPLTRFTKRNSSYRKVDGTVVATSFTALISGLLTSPIDLTENRTAGNNVAWTATTATGVYAAPNCNDWKDSQGMGRAGLTGAIDEQWSLVGNFYGCSVTLALYCIEQ